MFLFWLRIQRLMVLSEALSVLLLIRDNLVKLYGLRSDNKCLIFQGQLAAYSFMPSASVYKTFYRRVGS